MSTMGLLIWSCAGFALCYFLDDLHLMLVRFVSSRGERDEHRKKNVHLSLKILLVAYQYKHFFSSMIEEKKQLDVGVLSV